MQVIIREAIHEGPLDSSMQSSLINWALPYAQRYLCCVHPEKYSQLKESRFDNVKNLHVLVVEKLFYRNLIKHIKESSKKQCQCSSILQVWTQIHRCMFHMYKAITSGGFRWNFNSSNYNALKDLYAFNFVSNYFFIVLDVDF